MLKTKIISTPMPGDLERKARITAAHVGISRAELVRRALVDYLERLTRSTEMATVKEGNYDQV